MWKPAGVLLTLACLAAPVRAEVEAPVPHCDIPGAALTSAKANTADECRALCEKEARCKAYVHVSGWGRCFLKAKLTRKVPLKFYSGAIVTDQKTGTRQVKDEAYDVDYPGRDLKRLSGTKTKEACRDACLAEPKCLAFGYLEGYADCWLKDGTPQAQTKVFSCGVRKDGKS
jgi:hypothetical protein